MPIITLIFPHPINVSTQIGDIAYFSNTFLSGIFPSAPESEIIMIGRIINILEWDGTSASLVIDMDETTFTTYGLPPVGAFIMFSKDNKANLSSLLGYYAEIEFRNNSTEKAELFSVGVGFAESSK
jgi:hypothetical protein